MDRPLSRFRICDFGGVLAGAGATRILAAFGAEVIRIEGERLLWNWQLNRTHYYDWENMTASWAADGVKPMVYMNPFFANLSNIKLREN